MRSHFSRGRGPARLHDVRPTAGRARLASQGLRCALALVGFSLGCTGRSIVANEPARDASVDHPTVPGAGGFDPRVHGFSFANYDNSLTTSNLTVSSMVRLFGQGVCEAGSSPCALTPVATQWMNDTNARMDIGHCEGMAILSTLLHQRVVPVSSFQPGAANAFALSHSPQLDEELALWWATQTVPDLADEDCPAASQMLSDLERSLRGGSGEAYSLAMWTLVNDEYEGGHAVTPVAVERMDAGADQADLLVYDNNFPGETRAIHYSSVASGAWMYVTSQNPDAAAANYTGNDHDNPICIRRVNARLAQPSRCFFCGEFRSPTSDASGHQLRAPSDPMALPMPGVLGGGARNSSISSRSNRRTGNVFRVLLSDGAGHVLDNARGDGGDVANGRALRLTSLDPGSVRAEPMFTFREGAAVRFTIQSMGSDPSAMEPIDARFFGAGYSLAVEGIDLSPGETDLIALAPTGAGMVYQTHRDDSAAVVVSATLPGDDWRFTVRTRGHAGGETIGAALDTARQELDFYFIGASEEMHSFDLEVERVNDHGPLHFTHMGTVEPGGAVLHLRYGQWSHEGDLMPLAVDRNDDGTPEAMEMLTDNDDDAGAP